MTGVTNNGAAIESYGYDALDRRAWTACGSVTNWHIYDGSQVTADVDSTGGVLRTYLYGPPTDELLAMTIQGGPGAPRTVYAIRDHQNTICGLLGVRLLGVRHGDNK
jgi:YD repeat-containing protein